MAKLKTKSIVYLAVVFAVLLGITALIVGTSLPRGAAWDWVRTAALLAYFSAYLAVMSNLNIRELTKRLGMPFVKAHHILTAFALAMMFAHPLLFALRVASLSVFVPTFSPLYLFLANGGRVALWLFALGALAAVLRKRLARGWRWAHWLVYLGFLQASIHGALIGTNFSQTGYRVLAGLLAASVLAAFAAKRLPKRKPARAG